MLPSVGCYRVGRVSRENVRETGILERACQDIRQAGSVPPRTSSQLEETFEKRFSEAMRLVEQGKIRQVNFRPSGRTVWVVTGRKKEYQVMPESMFCTCDDYYFRVMGHKKQLCYHLIAQNLAVALAKHTETDMADSSYARFTAKWKPAVDEGT